MSTERLRLSRRDSRLVVEECLLSRELWCLEERLSEECLSEECFDDEDVFVFEDLLDDFSLGTSRMFRMRPVVGSVVDDCPGSWETWYPSMM